ncbi:hypothetical protein C1646_750774 [Rhizophagus diaphanus]|nr:hypothetical protein C1646_750774 [Rhizophagus diaphanus] [Rhizophagus sp. MUCL 43196]
MRIEYHDLQQDAFAAASPLFPSADKSNYAKKGDMGAYDFDMMDPLSHSIFKNLEPPEIHQEGYKKLIACCENSLERMRIIYKQDVIKSEPRNAQGRRALEVRRTKHKDYTDKKRTETGKEKTKER